VHGNNKSDEELAAAAEAGRVAGGDGRAGRGRALRAAGVQRVLLRITPGVEADTHEKIRTGHVGSKFGVPPEEALEVSDGAAEPGWRCWACTCTWARRSRMRRGDGGDRVLSGSAWTPGPSWTGRPAIVNVGGGLGIRYVMDEPALPTRRSTRARSRSAVRSLGGRRAPEAQLVFEPAGRSSAGRRHLYRVGVVKRSGGTTWVAVDGGMSDNPRPPSTAPATRRPCRTGPTSTGRDVRRLRQALRERRCPDRAGIAAQPGRGDVLAVPATGAYSLSMASNYNALPRPAAVLVGNATARSIRARESVETLL
jgi:diaminopimelate decarboxylase